VPPNEVHPITGPDIDAHFAHSATDGLDVAEMAEAGSFQASKDSGLGTGVSESSQSN
jgi:hypothetical protein